MISDWSMAMQVCNGETSFCTRVNETFIELSLSMNRLLIGQGTSTKECIFPKGDGLVKTRVSIKFCTSSN